MTNENLRMQMLSGIITEGEYKEKLEENDSTENKKSLKENFVGIGAINNPFAKREKTGYETAFEHFLSERYETKFENREQDLEEGEEMGGNMFKVGDTIRITAPLDASAETDEGMITKVYPNFNSITSEDIGYYEVDADAYDESALNGPWYKVDHNGEEELYPAEELELN